MPDLLFDEMSHTYTREGVVVPHVTGILAPLESWFGVPAAALEYASDRGRAVHLATQLWDEGDLDETSIDPVIAPYFAAYQQFLADASPEWHGIEEKVYHEQYGYAGMLDRRGVLKAIKGSPEAVIDIKAVAQVSPATGVQTAAYDAAAPTTKKKRRRFALQLRPNGTYKLHEFAEPSDWPVFCSLNIVHQWRLRHGKLEKPE